MESILRGILGSNHPEKLKTIILAKYLHTIDDQIYEISASDCCGLFKLFIEWILTSENIELRKHGHENLVKVAKAKSEYFREFISPKEIIDIFSNSNVNKNKSEIAPLIGEILDLLRFDEDFNNADHLRGITNVAKAHLIHFLKDQGIHLDVAASIGKLYSSQPATLLPGSPSDWQKMTSQVVTLLAGYRCKNPHPVTNVVSTNFVEKSDLVSDILSRIWGQSLETRACIQESLRLFYVIISTSDSDSRPSCALMSFIDKVPSNMMEKAMDTIIDDSNHTHIHTEEGRTVFGLLTMVEWLTQRPGTLLAGWIMHMLIGLKKSRRYSVLIEITHGTLEKLLCSLPVPELQDTVENLFFFLLLGFQHSETAFHRIVSTLPDILTKLQKNATSQTVFGTKSKILERLVEATYFMLKLFPDFPDLYSSLLKKMEGLTSIPQPDDNRIEELTTLAWLPATVEPQKQLDSTDGGTIINTGIKPLNLLKNIPGNHHTVDRRSETGMVGLVNLGNTCYMNSVIQALYVTTRFCDLVLSAPSSGNQQPVLAKLQLTFAFLRETVRALYSPSEFLKSARPPWFESGRQQDCSEFLRYLLDTLQEQEKSSQNSRTFTNFREHRVIEPPSPSSSKTLALNVSPDQNSEAMEVKTSTSISALDAISEAPEPEDVDMMSQEEDEDFAVYGSRCSLSSPNEKPGTSGCSDDEPEVSEDEDMGGSRNSLSGLKRWTTEENLSMNESGSRTELMDTPLHDSHSNSTDSGIQSVGDSIRGSSDSMTNGGGGVNNLGGAATNNSLAASTASTASTRSASSNNMTDYPSNICKNEQDPSTALLEKKTKKAPVLDGATVQKFSATAASEDLSDLGGESQKTPKSSPKSASNCQSSNSCTESEVAISTSDFVSLVHKVFGGKLQTTYQCSNCKSISLHKEGFTDLHLAFPEKKSSNSQGQEGSSSAPPQASVPLTMQKLLENYLKPEILQGDNKYHCDHCGNLQEAVKTMKILEGPEYLMTTLMRFHYDRKQNRKTKVFTDINYELELSLPVFCEKDQEGEEGSLEEEENNPNIEAAAMATSMVASEGNNTDLEMRSETVAAAAASDQKNSEADNNIEIDSENEIVCGQNESPPRTITEKYSLYAVVVHSGYSSDGGHYYTYARQPPNLTSEDNPEAVEAINKDSTWYIFNDSKVSFTSFESFKTISKRFPRDTAYLLFYQKVTTKSNDQNLGQPNKNGAKLRRELKMSVENDNIKFMREKERSSNASVKNISNSWQFKDDRNDPDQDRSRGCGGGGFNTPGRFVC